MAFVRDAMVQARTATLEQAQHPVKLARGQANANRVKEGDGQQADSFRGLTACPPLPSQPDPDRKPQTESRLSSGEAALPLIWHPWVRTILASLTSSHARLRRSRQQPPSAIRRRSIALSNGLGPVLMTQSWMWPAVPVCWHAPLPAWPN